MKTTFKISPLTYIITFSVLLCGYFNYFLIIFLILLIHDLGHILLIKRFNYQIESILILPFGSLINSNIKNNIPSYKLFLISIAGIIFQLILAPIFHILYSNGIVNDISYNIFKTYNTIIIVFNLLPIIPLDGSKIMQSILETKLPYHKTIACTYFISLIFIFIFFIKNTITLNLILVTIFMFYETYKNLINIDYTYNYFLLERFLYDIRPNKIKYVKDLNSLYKNYFNFINNESEKNVLKRRFKP